MNAIIRSLGSSTIGLIVTNLLRLTSMNDWTNGVLTGTIATCAYFIIRRHQGEL